MIKYLIPKSRAMRLWTVDPDHRSGDLLIGLPLADGDKEMAPQFQIVIEELATHCSEERAAKLLLEKLRTMATKTQVAYATEMGERPEVAVLVELEPLNTGNFDRPEDDKKVVFAMQEFVLSFLSVPLSRDFDDCRVKKLPYE